MNVNILGMEDSWKTSNRCEEKESQFQLLFLPSSQTYLLYLLKVRTPDVLSRKKSK